MIRKINVAGNVK